MFMGDCAFVFYFPVIDKYIRHEEPKHDFDDVAWILAKCIEAHVSADRKDVQPLYGAILSLCNFVLDGLGKVSETADRGWTKPELEEAWTDLQRKTATAI